MKRVITVLLSICMLVLSTAHALAANYCTNCGAAVSPTAKFCSECGASVQSASVSTTGTPWDGVLMQGSIVTFGSYNQSSQYDDTPVRWIVLSVQGDKALLLSEYGLDVMTYNNTLKSVNWESCTLRSWMNISLFDSMFTPNEKLYVATTSIGDRVFLLSEKEVQMYSAPKTCKPTQYAKQKGAYIASDGMKTSWWIRSNTYSNYAPYVGTSGKIRKDSNKVTASDNAIRPAIWLSLSGDSESIATVDAGTSGIVAVEETLSTRSGPNTKYSWGGNYKSSGTTYQIFSRKNANGITWVQVQIESGGKLYRLYTGAWRLSVTSAQLAQYPEEKILYHSYLNSDATVCYGPGTEYARLRINDGGLQTTTIGAGTDITVYAEENGYAQVDFEISGQLYRGWIKKNAVSSYRY